MYLLLNQKGPVIPQRAKKEKLLGLALALLVLYNQWGWFFYKTIYANKLVGNMIGATIFMLFLALLLQEGKPKKLGKLNTLWVLYLFLSVAGCVFSYMIVTMFSWFAYFVILLIASKIDVLEKIPAKVLFWSGFVAMIGVYVQFFFQSFYSSYIDGIFIREYMFEENVLDIMDSYGMHGFTFQQSDTSILLIFGFISLFYLKEVSLPIIFQRKVVFWALAALFIIAIFFTGKRTMSGIAIIVPFAVLYLSERGGIKKIGVIVAIIVSLLLIYNVLLPILFESYDIFFIRRLNETLEMSSGRSAFETVSTGREALWQLAIKAWKENPFLGVGFGRYMEYTQSNTDAHNTYLQVLCEQGVIVFAIYVSAIIKTLINTVHLLRKTYNFRMYLQASLAMQLVYILYAFTGNVNLDSDITMLVLAAAMTIRINRITELRNARITTHIH